KTGLSVVLYDDKTGPSSRTGGQFGLSYGIKLDNTDKKKLMFVLGGSFLQYKIDKTEILNDPTDYGSDQTLMNAPSSRFTGDAAAGVYLKTPTYDVGVSVQQIIQTQLSINNQAATSVGKLYRHYY